MNLSYHLRVRKTHPKSPKMPQSIFDMRLPVDKDDPKDQIIDVEKLSGHEQSKLRGFLKRFKNWERDHASFI